MTVKKKIDLFIFDLDGTLIDSRQDLANAVNYTRKLYQMEPVHKELVASNIGHGVRNLINKSIPQLPDGELDKAISTFTEYYQSHCVDDTVVYSGILDVLEYFKNKSMAIVSNKPYSFTMKILQEKGLSPYFQLVLGEESYPKKKPDPAPLLYVMEQLKGKPETSCMVGDYITDIEAGKRAGMTTVGCLYGIGNIEEVKAYKPDYLVESISEIKDLFE